MNKKCALRRSICFASLLILAAVFFVLELVSGSTDMSASEVFSALTGSGSSAAHTIVSEIRLPRAIAAALLGGALSVSGFLLQSFFNNPIAGPYVLGISSPSL